MRILAGLVAVALAVGAILWLIRDLTPPRSLSFAAGASGGGYHAIAQRYAARLASEGIFVSVLETAGSVENASRLAEGDADVALLQGGIPAPDGMEALAAVFYEPLFVFAHQDAPVPSNVGAWRALSLAVGAEGSGTRAAALALLAAGGVGSDAVTLLPLGGAEAAEAVRTGDADAAIFVAPLSAPYLRPLFEDGAARLMQLEFLEALSIGIDHADIVTLPAGAARLDPPLPPEPVRLIAMTARLVAAEDLHPALVDRLVTAALRIHAGRDAVTPEGGFPSTEGVTMPFDPYARGLIESGPSPLTDVLPFWIVAQINRVAFLLVPIVLLLLPVLRSLPGLYQWRMRAQVYRHYRELRDIDAEARRTDDAGVVAALRTRLDRIDDEIARLRLPVAYRHYAYTARLHVELIRAGLNERMSRLRFQRGPNAEQGGTGRIGMRSTDTVAEDPPT